MRIRRLRHYFPSRRRADAAVRARAGNMPLFDVYYDDGMGRFWLIIAMMAAEL